MITLVLIRHPETEGNLVSNSEMAELERPNHMFLLSKRGEDQLESTVQAYTNLSTHRPTAVFHSTASRTRVLAYKLSQELKIDCFEDSRLNEKWDGIFHSLPLSEIEKRYPEQIALKEKYGWYHYRPPGGESGPDVEMRIRSFLRDLPENIYFGKEIIVVGHGNWLHLFEGIIEKKPWEIVQENKYQKPFPNGSITAYDFYPETNEFVKRLDRYVQEGTGKTPTKYA